MNELTLLRSDEVAILSLLTLISRALPAASDSSSASDGHCIEMARQALVEHYYCMDAIPPGNALMFEFYVNW